MCIRDRYVFARRGPEAACIRTRPGSRPPRLAWLRWLTGVVNGRSSWWRWKPPACTGSRSTTPWRTASGCGCATHTTSRMCRGVRPTCRMLTGWLPWPHTGWCGHVSQPVSIGHVGLTPRHILDVVCVAQPHPKAVLQGVVVKSGRGAVPVFRPARFLGPLPAPAVRLSPQRALHKSRGREFCSSCGRPGSRDRCSPVPVACCADLRGVEQCPFLRDRPPATAAEAATQLLHGDPAVFSAQPSHDPRPCVGAEVLEGRT